MRIIIPMAGEGKRFLDAGYKEHKAVLPMIYRKTGERCPMVVCSVKDLPGLAPEGENLAFIMRDFHMKTGVDGEIRKWYPRATFFATDTLTQGQACTCLLAREFMDDEDELLIAACDNGIEYDPERFDALRQSAETIVFTSRHDCRVEENPDAFGWVRVNERGGITGVSVKKRISDTPLNDHAIVATFWFRHAKTFVQAAEKMIAENDRIRNEFYVDEVVRHVLELRHTASAFEVKRFLNYGTPEDYENYGRLIERFAAFAASDAYRGA